MHFNLNFLKITFDSCFGFKLDGLKTTSRVYLVGTGGLVGAVVIAEVLVGFGGLSLTVDGGVQLVDGRDVVAQGDGLHRLVDATADTFADFRARRLGLPRRSRATGAAVGGLGGHLIEQQT